MEIVKVKNENPRITFLTPNGKRTPKEVWLNTETGHRDRTKRAVKEHDLMLQKIGITKDMTEEEVVEQAKKFLALQNN